MKLRRLLFFLFFLSGFSALVYEVVWARQLGLIFGNTVYAISTVLAVFFGGLALGSYLFGRVIDSTTQIRTNRKQIETNKRIANPLIFYAFLELGIGLYAGATPWIFKLIENLQISFGETGFGFSFLTFGFCFLGLIIPTILMGGTLPVIAKTISQMQTNNKQIKTNERIGKVAGSLYSVNTAGAVLGTFLAGFFLIPALGVKETIWLAAGINLVIGFIAFGLTRIKTDGLIQSPVQTNKKLKKTNRLIRSDSFEVESRISLNSYVILIAYFLAGFAALALEVLWARVLILTFGSSAYAFATILMVFLLGIALGSFLASKFLIGKRSLLYWLAGIEIGLGLIVILLIPLLGNLPLFSLSFYRQTSGFMTNLQVIFLFSFLVILLPTLLMGAAFPIALQAISRMRSNRGRIEANKRMDAKKIGSDVGVVYSVNTAGGILGSLTAGFVLIPLMGLQKGILLASFFYFLAGFLVLTLAPLSRKIKAGAVLSVIFLVVSSFFLPSWDKKILSSGTFVYFRDYLEAIEIEAAIKRGKILFYEEGVSSTVVVFEKNGKTFLRIDGKTDASNTKDLNTELLLGHLPLLFHKNPKEVLVVGLGSGITLGAVEQYGVDRIDVVEIEPAVVEAARYFDEDNHSALADERARLIIGDGRNFLLTTKERYDVISSEPSNPWVKGNANLFTKEYYKLAREHLKDEGLFLQWAHLYYLSKDDLKTVLATFQAVFPRMTVWSPLFSDDLLLLGTKKSLSLDFSLLEERFKARKVKEDLSRIGISQPAQALGLFLFGEKQVGGLIEGARLHTDNYPLLEFSTPKSLGEETVGKNLGLLLEAREEPFSLFAELNSWQKKEIEKHLVLKENVFQGKIALERQELEKSLDYLLKALEIDSDREQIKKEVAAVYFYLAEGLFSRNEIMKAKQALIESINFDFEQPLAHLNLGAIYYQEGNLSGAAMEWKIAQELDPERPEIKKNLELLEKVMTK